VNEAYIRDRITELRLKKGISEYKMSLELGHSRSYIQSIVSGRTLPSMTEFLNICEYLNITPKDFFDQSVGNPELIQKAVEGLKTLDDSDILLILNNINRLMIR
jgi:transcriptional regulator with XRE-family HTH domain